MALRLWQRRCKTALAALANLGANALALNFDDERTDGPAQAKGHQRKVGNDRRNSRG